MYLFCGRLGMGRSELRYEEGLFVCVFRLDLRK